MVAIVVASLIDRSSISSTSAMSHAIRTDDDRVKYDYLLPDYYCDYWDPVFQFNALTQEEEVDVLGPGAKPVFDFGFGSEVMNLHSEANGKARQKKYIQRFQRVAIQNMVQFGIPASITLSQGILESNAGASTLAKSNNHFGIKCFKKAHQCRSSWHCVNREDDHKCDVFLRFNSAYESYSQHSKVLKKKRYSKLYKLSPTDYKGWALGLKRAGYATSPTYDKKLIRLIEEYELHKLDNFAIKLKSK